MSMKETNPFGSGCALHLTCCLYREFSNAPQPLSPQTMIVWPERSSLIKLRVMLLFVDPQRPLSVQITSISCLRSLVPAPGFAIASKALLREVKKGAVDAALACAKGIFEEATVFIVFVIFPTVRTVERRRFTKM